MADKTMDNGPHPTKEKLILSVLHLSEIQDISAITVDAVLEATGVSKGSLYHHFDDLDDLVSQAKSRLFSIGVDRSIELMWAILKASGTAEEFNSRIRGLILDTLTPEGVRQRLTRARILGASLKFPKLHQYILIEQKRLTDEIAEVLAGAKSEGLVKKTIDPHIAAVFIQTYTFGKILDDLSETPVDPDKWVDWIMSILAYKILA